MIVFFVAILLIRSLTLVDTLAAASKRPILSYKLIGALALWSTLFAIQQVVNRHGNPFALMFTVLSGLLGCESFDEVLNVL